MKFGYLTKKEIIYGVHGKSGIQVSIGQRKKKFCMGYGQSGFFFHFADDTFFAAFEAIGKSTGKIKCTFGRFFAATAYQKLMPVVDDDCHCGRTWIEVIDEAAVFTSFGFFIVNDKV